MKDFAIISLVLFGLVVFLWFIAVIVLLLSSKFWGIGICLLVALISICVYLFPLREGT